jgi:hypothetical protein
MKNKLFYFFIISILTSCSTYNHQSNNEERYIYELKTEPKEALFTERKFTKGSHTLTFYIHDLDDSTFLFKNVQIYDSTLTGKLEPVQGKIGRDQLNIKNIRRKNEVHIDIDRQCTDKNSVVYLEPMDIDKFQAYSLTQQEIDRTKGGRKFGVVFLTVGTLVLGVSIFSLFN